MTYDLNSRRPDLTVTSSGRIDITVRLCRLLNLEPGDVVAILEHDGELFLTCRLKAADAVGRHRGVCVFTNKTKGSLRTWSVAMTRRLLDASRPWHGDLQILRLPCGDPEIIDGHTAIPIITRINIEKQ